MRAIANKSDLRKAVLIAKKRKARKANGLAQNLEIKTGAGELLVSSGTEYHRIITRVPADIEEHGSTKGDIKGVNNSLLNCDSGELVVSNDPRSIYNKSEEPDVDNVFVVDDYGDRHFDYENSDFEVLDQVDNEIAIKNLQESFEEAYYMVSGHGVKENLRQVHSGPFGSEAGIKATDGSGAYWNSYTLPIPYPVGFNRDTAMAISYTIKKEKPEQIKFKRNPNGIYCFVIGDTSIIFREHDEKFPELSSVYPDNYVKGYEIELQELKRMVEEPEQSTDNAISLQFDDQSIYSSSVGDKIVSQEKLEGEGELPLEIQLDASLFLDELNASFRSLPSDASVEVQVLDKWSPIRIKYRDTKYGANRDVVFIN